MKRSDSNIYFENNISAFEKINIHINNHLPNTTLENERLAVAEGKRSTKILSATDSHGQFFLSSLYDPISEAKRFVSTETFSKEFNVVVIIGFGLGYILNAALDATNEETKVIVVEPSLEHFHLQLEAEDFTSLIQKERVNWIIGKSAHEAVGEIITHLDVLKLKGWVPLISPSIHRLYRDYTKEFFNLLDDQLTAQRLGKTTDLVASETFLKNSLTNLKHALGAPGVMHFYEAWKHRPAIIVSAGPSLEQHLPLLKKYQNNILLICVGAAWKSLRAADIEPHIVVAVDPFKDNYPHFEGLAAKREWLVADFACNTDVVRTFIGKKIFANSTPSKEAIFRSIYGEWGILISGGSVANSAFSFALTMGAWPIVLVGQDLAYTGGISHATGHTGKHSLADALKSNPEAFKQVEGYGDGLPVLTNMQMLTYKLWFEESILQLEEGRVINATEGGAKIARAVERKLIEVLEEFGQVEIRQEELWPPSYSNQTFVVDDIISKLKNIRGKIIKIKNASEAAYAVMQKLIKRADENKRRADLEAKYNKLAKQISHQNDAVDFFLTAFVQQEIFFTQRRINLVERKEDLLEKYRTNLILHTSLPKACQRAASFVDDVVDSIRGS